MTDKVWAWVGRLAAAIIALAGFVVTAGEIYDRLRGADIEAAITFRDTEINPVLSKALKESVEPAAIEKALFDSQANTEDIYQLRDRMRKLAQQPSSFRFDTFGFQREVVEIEIFNHGPDVADKVRILAPSGGHAVVVEPHIAGARAPVEWSEELVVGPVRPGGRLMVTLWFNHITGSMELRLPPGIVVEHNDRSRPVYESRTFHGPIANTWAWFLAFAWVTRAIMAASLVLTLGLLCWLLVRKGFLVLRPSSKVPVELLATANRKLANAERQDVIRVQRIQELEKSDANLKELLGKEQRMSGLLEQQLDAAHAAIERVTAYATNGEVLDAIGKEILRRLRG